MRSMALGASLAAGAATLVPAPDAGAQEVAPDAVVIRSVVARGSGCPGETATAEISPDRLAVTVVFSELDAKVGPGVPPGESHELCKVTLMLDYPSTWSYSLISADYMGVANIGAGLTGEQRSTYQFHGQPHEARTFATTVAGPSFGQFVRHDEISASAALWSACGRRPALTIDVEVAVSRARDRVATGLMNVMVADIAAVHLYGLAWRRC